MSIQHANKKRQVLVSSRLLAFILRTVWGDTTRVNHISEKLQKRKHVSVRSHAKVLNRTVSKLDFYLKAVRVHK